MPLPEEGQNAFNLMKAMLTEWGLESLAQTVYDFLIQGYSQDNISFLLKETPAYKQRFAANEKRKAQGLPVLSPAEYLSVERSYRQIMSSSGIPEGFWDQQSDFTDLIGRDISPVELQHRVTMAEDTAAKVDQNTHDWFSEQYGLDFNTLDRGALVGYLLDPQRGMDTINRVIRGGSVAGAARGRGVDVSREQAERFGAAADAQQYMAQSRQFAEVASRGSYLSDLYGGAYDVERAGADVFLGDTAAAEQRRKLGAREVGEFSGSGQPSQTALGSSPGSV